MVFSRVVVGDSFVFSEDFMQIIYDVLNWIDGNILWGVPMIIFMLFTGIFLSSVTKFLQLRKFGYAMRHTLGLSVKHMKRNKTGGNGDKTISPFEAFSTAVSGTVGTGNIVGVTTAILSGGPGAVFWMWVSAFFGSVTKYAEIVLGVYYRKKNTDGEYIGGPMHYIENGVGRKWLAMIFAVFAILAAVGMGSVQADTIEKTWSEAFGIPVYVTATIIVLLTALVIIGGIKRIGKVTSYIVPFMAILFIILAIVLVAVNISAVPSAFASIFTSAFSAKSFLGGFAGYGIAQAMRYGFARGIFSNEAGLGSSSIAHSSSDTSEPVEQGLWGIFEVFLDTFVICTLTALFVLTSGLDGAAVSDGATVAMGAFTSVFGIFGKVAYSIILPLFAFSTILAWAVYGAKSSEYLFGKHHKGGKTAFNVLYLTLIIAIALLTYFFEDNIGTDFVWLISDMTNALMALPNLIALVVLSKQTVAVTRNYFARKRGEPFAPMISAFASTEDTFSAKE